MGSLVKDDGPRSVWKGEQSHTQLLGIQTRNSAGLGGRRAPDTAGHQRNAPCDSLKDLREAVGGGLVEEA